MRLGLEMHCLEQDEAFGRGGSEETRFLHLSKARAALDPFGGGFGNSGRWL